MVVLLREHLHLMRMSLLSLPEHCPPQQEEYVTRFHGMVALRCLLALGGHGVVKGGFSAYRMAHKWSSALPQVHNYGEFAESLGDLASRIEFHCCLVRAFEAIGWQEQR